MRHVRDSPSTSSRTFHSHTTPATITHSSSIISIPLHSLGSSATKTVQFSFFVALVKWNPVPATASSENS